MKTFRTLSLLGAVLWCSGCVSFFNPLIADHPRWSEMSGSEKSLRRSVVQAAEAHMMTPEALASDCSGIVLGSYRRAGIDPQILTAAPGATGVHRLYNRALASKAFKKSSEPKPGDLVFWDNTWDADGNGQADDPLTHVGLVISMDDEGTIQFLHYHVTLGPVVETMNLVTPGVRYRDYGFWREEINSPMRMNGAPAEGFLAGELYRGYADLSRLVPGESGT